MNSPRSHLCAGSWLAKKLERVKGIEPSSSAWKSARKSNDFKGVCVDLRPENVQNATLFANAMVGHAPLPRAAFSRVDLIHRPISDSAGVICRQPPKGNDDTL